MPCYSSLPCPIISLLSVLCCCLILGQLASASERLSLPGGCPSTCGNLTIPYPFGIGTECAREGFNLTCDHSFHQVNTFIGNDFIEVLNISLNPPEVRVNNYRAFDCYSNNGSERFHRFERRYNYPFTSIYLHEPYTFSNIRNKFTVIGCDSYAYIDGDKDTGLSGGCISMCSSLDQVVNGSCSGIGCCQVSIPKGLKFFKIEVKSFFNHEKIVDFSPCSYAFLVDQDWFTFRSVDITDNSIYTVKVPVVLDWVAGNESCAVAIRNLSTYACRSRNSYCYDSNSSATGYLCNCSSGYEGNPYLSDGCQDIDECRRPDVYICKGVCVNNQGSYLCTCPKGFNGNPTIYCIEDKNINFGTGEDGLC